MKLISVFIALSLTLISKANLRHSNETQTRTRTSSSQSLDSQLESNTSQTHSSGAQNVTSSTNDTKSSESNDEGYYWRDAYSHLGDYYKNLHDEKMKGKVNTALPVNGSELPVPSQNNNDEGGMKMCYCPCPANGNTFGWYSNGTPIIAYNKSQYDAFGNGGDDYDDPNDEDPAPDIVFVIFEAIAKEVFLPSPKSLIPCLDKKSGRIILNFIFNLMGEVNDYGFERIYPTVLAFQGLITEPYYSCFAKSKDLKQIKRAYGITQNSLVDFYMEIANFGLNTNATKIAETANIVLQNADVEKFIEVGKYCGKFIKIVWPMHKFTI